MNSHQTNIGRDRVEVYNRLDKVVLAIHLGDAGSVETPMTPADARTVAEHLREAAEIGERTTKD